nr:hypothetical protein [uncultured Pseudomonas sp.]
MASAETADARPHETTDEKAATSELPATLVDAQASAAEPLPPVYAGGQVATGGRVGFLGNKDFMETPFSTVSYTDTYIQDLQA